MRDDTAEVEIGVYEVMIVRVVHEKVTLYVPRAVGLESHDRRVLQAIVRTSQLVQWEQVGTPEYHIQRRARIDA